MASPPDQTSAMLKSLEDKTGRPLKEWLRLVAGSGSEKHGEIVKFLKSEHGVSHGYANLIAHEARKAIDGEGQAPDPVDQQYVGKEGLRPIYDRLIRIVTRFGTDVDIQPKKAYVSLRRSRQFAIIQPSTKSRLDVGLQLKGTPPGGRLEPTGSFSSMVSHRVRVGRIDEVDEELTSWLRRAYDSA